MYNGAPHTNDEITAHDAMEALKEMGGYFVRS